MLCVCVCVCVRAGIQTEDIWQSEDGSLRFFTRLTLEGTRPHIPLYNPILALNVQNKNSCVIFFFFFSNVVTIRKVRENSGWIRSRNLKAPSIAIRVQLACTPRKFREGKAGEHTELKRRGRLLTSLSLASHHFSVSSLCWPHFEWRSTYCVRVCVCVCARVCVDVLFVCVWCFHLHVCYRLVYCTRTQERKLLS